MQILAFEEDFRAGYFIERTRSDNRRAMDAAGDPRGGLLNQFKCQHKVKTATITAANVCRSDINFRASNRRYRSRFRLNLKNFREACHHPIFHDPQSYLATQQLLHRSDWFTFARDD